MLLSAGANPNSTAIANRSGQLVEGYTPLMFAVLCGNKNVILPLLHGGTDPNIQATNGATALTLAVANGYTEIVALLLHFNANPNNSAYDLDYIARRTPLILATTEGNDIIVQLLLNAGAHVDSQARQKTPHNGRTCNGSTALMYAAQHGHTSLVKLLLENGANSRMCNNAGYDPLQFAGLCKSKERTKIETILKKHIKLHSLSNAELLNHVTTIRVQSKEKKDIPLRKSCFNDLFIEAMKKGPKLKALSHRECSIPTEFSYDILCAAAQLLSNYEGIRCLNLGTHQTYVNLADVCNNYRINTAAKTAELIKAMRFFKLPLVEDTKATDLLLLPNASPTEQLYSTVETENLKALIEADKKHEQSVQASSSFVETMLEAQLNMLPSKKRKAAFCIAQLYEKRRNALGFNTILDERSWQSLEILAGPSSNASSFFAKYIDNTVTELGKAFLYKKIVYPTTNSTLLNKQKEIVQFLIQHPRFEKINMCLRQLGDIERESNMLSFWQPDEFYSWLKSTDIDISRWQNFSKWLNENAYAVEILREGPQLFLTILITKAGEVKDKICISLENFQSYLNLDNNRAIEIVKDIVGLGSGTFQEVAPIAGIALMASRHPAACCVGYACTAATMIKHADAMKEMITLRLALQKKLMLVAQYIACIKELYSCIKSSQEADLESRLPFVKALNLDELVTTQQDINAESSFLKSLWQKVSAMPDITTLLKNLETKTFTGDPSLFSFTGRVVATYRIMHECKDKLIDVLGAVGELDMHMSIARLFKKHQNGTRTFCLPEYVDAPNPCISIEDFWNPVVGHTKAVPKSLDIGCNGKPQNIIITGPNGGGKSTVMKSVVLGIILAQTLGICPAKKLTFTPFSKILGYLNITDDISKSQSLFQAIAQRAVDIQKEVSSLKSGQHSLTMFDELFDGTEAEDGQALATAFLKDLSTFKNNICLFATHFQQLPHELDSMVDHPFTNYCVKVDDTQEKLVYPYRLEPGISHQSIAFKVLLERGLAKELIEEAKKLRAKTKTS